MLLTPGLPDLCPRCGLDPSCDCDPDACPTCGRLPGECHCDDLEPDDDWAEDEDPLSRPRTAAEIEDAAYDVYCRDCARVLTDDEQDCADPAGRFAVELSETSGDCGPVSPFVLEVPLRADGPWLGCSVTNDQDLCSVRSRVECPDGLSYTFELRDAAGGDLRGTMTLRDEWWPCASTYDLDGEGF